MTAALFTCLSLATYSEKLRIVTQLWAPYVYDEQGAMHGLDYETTVIVFQRLGVEVQWQFLPWKRCLVMLEQGNADDALDIFQSPDRDALLLYPSKPLSEVEFVLFYANERPTQPKASTTCKGSRSAHRRATCMAHPSATPPYSAANRRPDMRLTSANCCWGASTW